jgi:GDP-4-dehydro-6-deoxy-D-mannose reductase
MKRVLITGITGFAGSHLADHVLAEHPGVEVLGTYRWRSRRDNIEHLEGKIRLLECDLGDMTALRSTLAAARPDAIFHLAAQSFVPTSWSSPAETFHVNVTGQIHLFEAIRSLGIDPVVQIACSSEEYGLVHKDETPIREDNPLRPLSPYAVSKVAQDFLAYQYFRSYGLRAIRTRGFNHEGPRRGEVFVMSNFAKQIAAIEAGEQVPVIRVGNLDSVRDFTDVRDMVRAYWLAAERGEPGEVYNIASGRGITIREMLDRLLAMARVEVAVETDPARLRPSDVEVLLGDSSKFRAATGWAPRIPLEQTLADSLDYWRGVYAARRGAVGA